MSNSNYTAILLILDNSGSMGYARQVAMQAALHKMLDEQTRKLAGYITVDVAYYDSGVYYTDRFADPNMLFLAYNRGGGGTATCNSFSRIMSEFTRNINALKEHERPGHVVVVVATDGDTGDTQYSGAARTHYTNGVKRGWEFAYLFAGNSSTPRGHNFLGIPDSNAIAHGFDQKGIQKMSDKVGAFVTMARGGAHAHF